MLNNVSVNVREKMPREMAGGGLVKVKAGPGVWTYRRKYPPVQSNEEKTSSKYVRKGLVEFSTIKRGSTLDLVENA
jgi:hypothetical protein